MKSRFFSFIIWSKSIEKLNLIKWALSPARNGHKCYIDYFSMRKHYDGDLFYTMIGPKGYLP